MCQPTNLSSHGPFKVDLCTCGSLHVHMGPAMLRLTPDSLPHLVSVLKLAEARLPAVQRTIAPAAAPKRHEQN
jgi:hypothetical protein